MATGVKTKPATPLVLQVMSSDIQCTAMLLPGKWLETNGADMTTDKDLIWCSDLLSNKTPTKEVEEMRRTFPPHADIEY